MCDTNSTETVEHLILHCPYSISVWNSSSFGNLVLQDSATTINIYDWINKHLSSDNTHGCSVLTTAWCIWRDRCFHTFQQKPLNTQCTVRLASRLISDTNELLASSSRNRCPTVVETHVAPSNEDLPHDCISLMRCFL